MKTMNISITSEQYEAIDQFTKKMGFANRSEFVRSILRFVMRKPEILADSHMSFSPPPIRDRKKILEAFRAEGKYSDAFLKDLEEGLGESSYFT